MFERDHHRRVALILQALDGEVLARHGCLFGGGTAMALRYGEYRESVDIDLLVSDKEGYRALRQSLGGLAGLSPITRTGAQITLAREVRADQYGIRTQVRSGDQAIKFEIVLEARITLETPAPADWICGVPSLRPLDLAAEKLLANADRWGDEAVHSRDLIDLAMMRPSTSLLQQACIKAETAYGRSIRASITQATQALRKNPQRLQTCMRAMQITGVSRAVLWAAIRRLEQRLASPSA